MRTLSGGAVIPLGTDGLTTMKSQNGAMKRSGLPPLGTAVLSPEATTPPNVRRPVVVTVAEFTGTFEGQTQVFLGLTDPEAPYRVFLLADPLRLVVDVQRSMA